MKDFKTTIQPYKQALNSYLNARGARSSRYRASIFNDFFQDNSVPAEIVFSRVNDTVTYALYYQDTEVVSYTESAIDASDALFNLAMFIREA